VSRAYASLGDFMSSTRHLLAAGGEWLAMKAKRPAGEISEPGSTVSFHVEQLDVPGLDADRCLVWMRPV
jgi:16S rRNA (guanine527-N7)-methyltransferase